MANIIEDLTETLERAGAAHEILYQCCQLWKEMPEHLRKKVEILRNMKEIKELPSFRLLHQRDLAMVDLYAKLRAAEEKIKSLEKKTP